LWNDVWWIFIVICCVLAVTLDDSQSTFTLNSGMMDRSRLTLCVFMFAVLAFNPFSLLFGSKMSSVGSENSGHYGRTLQSFEEDALSQGNSLFVWHKHKI
jgi:hypothetical protein